MFRFASVLIAVLACSQSALAGLLHGATYAAPATSIISGGSAALIASSPLTRSYTSPIAYSGSLLASAPLARTYAAPLHSASVITAAPAIRSYTAPIAHQYISAPLTRSYTTPLIGNGLYTSGYTGSYANSYASQSLYNAPLAGATYAAPLAHGAHLSSW